MMRSNSFRKWLSTGLTFGLVLTTIGMDIRTTYAACVYTQQQVQTAGGVHLFRTAQNDGWTITNNSDCDFQVTVYSAKMIDTAWDQQEFARQTYTVSAHTTKTYTVAIPTDCGYQYDLFYGPTVAMPQLLDGKLVGMPCAKRIDFNPYEQGCITTNVCPNGNTRPYYYRAQVAPASPVRPVFGNLQGMVYARNVIGLTIDQNSVVQFMGHGNGAHITDDQMIVGMPLFGTSLAVRYANQQCTAVAGQTAPVNLTSLYSGRINGQGTHDFVFNHADICGASTSYAAYDVVVYDCNPRAQCTGTSSSSSSSSTPTLTNNGTCTFANIPTNVTPGQTFPVTFQISNTGTKTWTATAANAPTGYKLMSTDPVDNTTWGTNRIAIGSNVNPGQTSTVTTTLTAPMGTGPLRFVFQMGEEGVARFGQVCQATINVVNASSSSSSISSSSSSSSVSSSSSKSSSSFSSSSSSSSSSSTSSSNSLDLSITKTANPSTVNAGGTTTFTITVQNNSNQTAQNVVVNDQLPSGMSLQTYATAFGNFSGNQWTIGTLNAGQSATLLIVATMNATGTVTNTATVTTSTPESNYGNNSASATVTSNNTGCTGNCNNNNNYTITKTDGRTDVDPGDELTYTITVRNNDTSNNNNSSVTVRDTLPDGLTAIDASDGGRISGRNVTWSNVFIAPGQSRTFRLDVEVDDDADGQLTNRAEVNGILAYDTDYVNGDDDNDDDVELDVTKTASTTEVFPGGMIEYTVTIHNGSNATVRNIRVTDTLPSNINVVDDGDSDTNSNGKLEWKIGSLGKNDSKTFHYRISLSNYYQPGSSVRNDVRVRADDGIDERASTTVMVIGNLPQTGFLDFGSNGSEFLTPMSGSTSSTATTTGSILFWLSAAGTATGAGAGFIRKKFMGI